MTHSHRDTPRGKFFQRTFLQSKISRSFQERAMGEKPGSKLDGGSIGVMIVLACGCVNIQMCGASFTTLGPGALAIGLSITTIACGAGAIAAIRCRRWPNICIGVVGALWVLAVVGFMIPSLLKSSVR